MVGKWKGSEAQAADDEEELQYPGTFIPPHQLSVQQENFMSVAGAASSVRTDRLKARAAILKATGFVEENGQAAAVRRVLHVNAGCPLACAAFGLWAGISTTHI